MNQSKVCNSCSKVYFKPARIGSKKWEKSRFCSIPCIGLYYRGKPSLHPHPKGTVPWNKGVKGVMKAWNKGVKMPQTTGLNNYGWKGEEASYTAVHKWVNLKKKKPSNCEKCGKAGNRYQIQWSNIDHKYSRNLNDYNALCVSCHKKHDSELSSNI